MRITKLACPHCKGTGTSPVLGFCCMWCYGTKRVSVATALKYADMSHCFGGAGYICGDHDLVDKHRMEAEATAIYALVGQDPPWKQKAGG